MRAEKKENFIAYFFCFTFHRSHSFLSLVTSSWQLYKWLVVGKCSQINSFGCISHSSNVYAIIPLVTFRRRSHFLLLVLKPQKAHIPFRSPFLTGRCSPDHIPLFLSPCSGVKRAASVDKDICRGYSCLRSITSGGNPAVPQQCAPGSCASSKKTTHPCIV